MARSDQPTDLNVTDEPATDTVDPDHDPTPGDDHHPDEPATDAPADSSTDTLPPEGDMNLLRELDDFLADIDRDYPSARARTTPEDQYQLYDRLKQDTRAQATVGVDYVREDGIAVDDDSYIGLLKVTPRNWLSLDESTRQSIMASYMSFLLSLKWPIAITSYPKEFDVSDHLEQFHEAGTRPGVREESQLLQYGRKYYIDWADRRIDVQNIKRRVFYIVVRVDADHVHAGLDSGSVLSRLPLIGAGLTWLRSKLRRGKTEARERVREDLSVREVRTRQKKLAENLGGTGVGLDIIRDRHETMAVLYHYYNHIDPLGDEFAHATMTEAESPTTAAADGGSDG